MVQPRAVMTIAGSDSGGGAGIEADLRTFAALGVHGTVALTAITAQNTYSVTAVCPLEAEMVAAQVTTVTDDIELTAVKTGMLARPRTVEAVAELAARGLLPRLVVDPVLVSSSGHALMEDGGTDAYRKALLPHALLTTPNLREAAVLGRVDVRELSTLDAIVTVGREILSLGPRYVLIKGGHFLEGAVTQDRAPDVLLGPDGEVVLDGPRIDTPNDHGTGCSLAAACVAYLALDQDVPTAVANAKSYVARALAGAAAWRIGKGHGPIDHMGWNA